MKKWRKALSCILLVIISSFTGCAEKKEESLYLNTSEKVQGSSEFVVKNQIVIPVSETATIIGNEVICAHKENENWRISIIDKNIGKIIQETKIVSNSVDGKLSMSKNKDAILLLRADEEENNVDIYRVVKNGESFNIGSIDMSDIPKTSELPYADNLMILDDGICYAWFRVKIVAKETGLKRFENAEDNIYYDTNRIYMVDEKGNIQGYVHEPERIIVCGTDGTDVYLLGQGEKSWFIEKVDTEGKLSDKQDVFGIGCLGEIKSGQYQFDGIELYYIFENALWKYIPQYGTNERILNLSDFGIIQERITCFQKLSDGFGFIVNNDKESIFIEIVQGKTERDVLKIAGICFGDHPEVQEAVAEFNAVQDKVQIELHDYMDGVEDFNDAISRMNLDIMRGNIPDLLMVSSPIDSSVYAGKGLLCDLYSLMKDDVDFSKEMIVSSVLSSYEENGKLYSIMPGFAIKSAWGKASELGSKNGKSFQEFRDFLKGGNGKRTVSGFSADESALVVLTTVLMDDFIDWEKGACYFDGEEFYHLLDFLSKDYKRYEYVPSGNGFVRDILDNKVTILFGEIFCVGDYLIQRQLYGDDLVFLGMPTDSGSGTALFAVGARIAISSKTKNKAAAWDFLKYYCEKDMPNRSYFPIMTQKFESQLRLSQEVITMSDEFGNMVEKPLAFYFDGVQNHMIYKATKKECDDLVSLVQSADRKFEYHPEIMKIIQEEVGSLMSGDKSIEDISEVIQNRVELYLKE